MPLLRGHLPSSFSWLLCWSKKAQICVKSIYSDLFFFMAKVWDAACRNWKGISGNKNNSKYFSEYTLHAEPCWMLHKINNSKEIVLCASLWILGPFYITGGILTIINPISDQKQRHRKVPSWVSELTELGYISKFPGDSKAWGLIWQCCHPRTSPNQVIWEDETWDTVLSRSRKESLTWSSSSSILTETDYLGPKLGMSKQKYNPEFLSASWSFPTYKLSSWKTKQKTKPVIDTSRASLIV